MAGHACGFLLNFNILMGFLFYYGLNPAVDRPADPWAVMRRRHWTENNAGQHLFTIHSRIIFMYGIFLFTFFL